MAGTESLREFVIKCYIDNDVNSAGLVLRNFNPDLAWKCVQALEALCRACFLCMFVVKILVIETVIIV